MGPNLAPAVFRLYAQCPQCSRHCAPEELVGTQPRCYRCQDWSERAAHVIDAAAGCQECLASWQQLRERAPGADVKVYVVPSDGIYKVLCRPCCDDFVRKSRFLYAGTAFRETMKL